MTNYIEVTTTESNESEIVEVTVGGYYSADVFEFDGEEWIITLDGDDTEKLVTEYIEESISYFKTDFILYHINEEEWITDPDNCPLHEELEEKISELNEDDDDYEDKKEALQDEYQEMISEWEIEQDGFPSWDELEDYVKTLQQSEDNSSLLRMIDSFERFVEEAIATDGAGHFLSAWDGKEVESSDLPEAVRLAVKEYYDLNNDQTEDLLGYRQN